MDNEYVFCQLLNFKQIDYFQLLESYGKNWGCVSLIDRKTSEFNGLSFALFYENVDTDSSDKSTSGHLLLTF